MEPIVYLPVETKYREMPSRLLIACHLTSHGYAVALGSHWGLINPPNQAALPPGIYLFKTVNKLQGKAMAMLKTNGHAVAAIDEEVLVFTDDRGYLVSFADNAADNCDRFFAQSYAHMKAVEKRFPVLAGKTSVTGNPRIDLMAPGLRDVFAHQDARTATLKPYILFNANYGSINSIWADSNQVTAMAEATGALDGPDPVRKLREFKAVLDWESQNLQAMVGLLQWTLNSLPGINVVVRPHPGERPRYWDELLARAPRTHVIARSDPHPWIMDAALVVHTGCTTGLEAALLGVPALNLLPRSHPNATQIVTTVNPTVRSVADAGKAIAAFIGGGKGPLAEHRPKTEAGLAKHLPSYRDGTAARLIAEGMAAHLGTRGAGSGFTLNWRGAFIEPELLDTHRDKYTATAGEVTAELAKAAHIAGLAPPRLSTIGDGLFLLTPL